MVPTTRLFGAITSCVLLLFASTSRADSPLTSTDLASAYSDLDEIRKAGAEGLDAGLMHALSDPAIPHDVRAAIINALGWDIEGQNNALTYFRYVLVRHGVVSEALTLEALSPQEALSLGYLAAMDDYFGLSAVGEPGEVGAADAIALVNAAQQKAPEDFSVALVAGLIRSQGAMQSDWCQVYQLVFSVLDAPEADVNMREVAIASVRDYVGIYAEYCD